MADNNQIFPNGVGGFFSQLGESLVKTTQSDIKLAETAKRENDAIAADASRYATTANQTMESLELIRQQGVRAREMANSDNIFDRITLMGEQSINPREYTHAGRAKVQEELSNNLALEGQILGAKAAASQYRVQAAETEHGLEVLQINAGVTKTKGLIAGAQIAVQGIQANEQMRGLALDKIQPDAMAQALAGPTLPNGSISLGGFEYTPTELRERKKAVETRDRLSFLNPVVTDPEYRAKLNISHEMQLNTMSSGELESLRANGYKMADGTQVEPGIWMQAWTTKNEIERSVVQTKVDQYQATNVMPQVIQEGNLLLQNTAKDVVAGSPLGAARLRFSQAMEQAVAFSETAEGQAATGKQSQLTAIDKARSQYIAAIDQEAMRKAGGNKEMANIYAKQMTGQEVLPEELGDVLRNRYVKKDGFGTVLDPQMATKLRETSDQILQQKRVGQQQQQMMGGEVLKDPELREQSFNEAFQKLRGDFGVEAVNKIQYDLSQRTDSPAMAAGMIPRQVQTLQIDSALAAQQEIQQKYGLTTAQMDALKRGDADAAGFAGKEQDFANMAVELNQSSVIAEYNAYEAHQPGLGYKMTQWYAGEAGKQGDALKAQLDPMKQALAGDGIREETANFANLYLNADEAATQRRQQKMTELQVGVRKPENSWMIMLNSSHSLSDSQRQMIYYDVLVPAMKQARAQNLNDDQTAEFTFNALNQYEPQDPLMKTAIRQFNMELPQVTDSFEKSWRAAAVIANQRMSPQQRATTSADTGVTQSLQKIMPWLKP